MSTFEIYPKTYFLSAGTGCLPGCRFCLLAGCRNKEERSLLDLKEKILRARAGGYKIIEFSSGILLRPEEERSELARFAKECEVVPSLQIDWKLRDFLKGSGFSGIERLNFLVRDEDVLDNSQASPHFFTFFPRSVKTALEFLRNNRSHLSGIHFHFSPHSSDNPGLTVREAYFLLEKAKKENPQLQMRPPLGREVWDHRIDPDLSLDASLGAQFSSRVPGADAVFSVIIPSFNSGALLRNVLRHLLEQDYDRKKFEIIVIDDGSADGTADLIRNFLAPEKNCLNYSYLYFPRKKQRRRGDGNFRAGISRNQGVKLAKGKYLCFLDSDIIVSRDYLKNLELMHKEYDVIQNIRLHLKNKKSNATVDFESIDPGRDTFVLESKYWGRLFDCPNWSDLPYFWKYTCTYSLSMPRDLFETAGGFKKTFVYYGFEDTDLGYRLWKMGAKFHLSKMKTYHIEAEEDRTEYRRSALERHLLLSKTAKVFYLNNLDPEIFMHFYSMMGGENSLGKRISSICRRAQKEITGLFRHQTSFEVLKNG